MAETGIEDVLRGERNGEGGCFSTLVGGFVVVVIFMVALGLLFSYCDPAPPSAPANATAAK